MAATVTVRAKLTSKIGFYIGDVCYEMTDEDYYADWSNNFEDFEGEHELRGHKFAIGGTAYGDGEYEDQHTVTVNTKTSTDIATEWTQER